MLRFLVADDHAIVRQHIRRVLEAQDGWQVCGEAATGKDAVEMAIALRPNFVLLDWSMPVLNGLDAAGQIVRQLPLTAVLILTMHDPEDLKDAALASGAGSCLLKTDLHRLPDEVRGLLKAKRPV
jgi:DNA-binding NarL/FixJ family response regulator